MLRESGSGVRSLLRWEGFVAKGRIYSYRGDLINAHVAGTGSELTPGPADYATHNIPDRATTTIPTCIVSSQAAGTQHTCERHQRLS